MFRQARANSGAARTSISDFFDSDNLLGSGFAPGLQSTASDRPKRQLRAARTGRTSAAHCVVSGGGGMDCSRISALDYPKAARRSAADPDAANPGDRVDRGRGRGDGPGRYTGLLEAHGQIVADGD